MLGLSLGAQTSLGIRDLRPELAKWEPVGGWEPYLTDGVTIADIRRLLGSDPPLLLYILFEASLGSGSGGDGGTRLGPLGSLIIADTLYGALAGTRFPFERSGETKKLNTLGDQLRAIFQINDLAAHAADADGAGRVEEFVEELSKIETMPDLILHMDRRAKCSLHADLGRPEAEAEAYPEFPFV